MLHLFLTFEIKNFFFNYTNVTDPVLLQHVGWFFSLFFIKLREGNTLFRCPHSLVMTIGLNLRKVPWYLWKCQYRCSSCDVWGSIVNSLCLLCLSVVREEKTFNWSSPVVMDRRISLLCNWWGQKMLVWEV